MSTTYTITDRFTGKQWKYSEARVGARPLYAPHGRPVSESDADALLDLESRGVREGRFGQMEYAINFRAQGMITKAYTDIIDEMSVRAIGVLDGYFESKGKQFSEVTHSDLLKHLDSFKSHRNCGKKTIREIREFIRRNVPIQFCPHCQKAIDLTSLNA